MVGSTVVHYKIIEKIGAGGMGVVYKAMDTKLNRYVALKFLPRHISFNPEIRKRFILEAQAAAALNHPNITTIHDTLEADDELFIVMEYIEGCELSKKIAEGPIEIAEATDLTLQIFEGLNEAHKRGIIHRDIKSSNIMLTPSGRIKIMDFGLAKFKGQTMMTQLGTTLGTINYMSPEQTRGEEVDQRTDIWAVGVILYEMLTGGLPFKGDYEQAVIYSILNEEPKPITSFNGKGIPTSIEQLIKKLLFKNPADRYQQVEEVVHDLKSIKRSIETGIPIELLESKSSTAVHMTGQIPGLFSRAFWIKYNVAILSSVIALMVILAFYFNGNMILQFIGLGATSGEIHLAVLEFENIGSSPENKVFTDGLVETLTSKLSQLEQFEGRLWVVPASEVRKEKIESAGDAYNKFGVNLVLTGSVQELNKEYRLTINLVNAESKRQITSRLLDNPLMSASFLQDEVIIKVAEMLNIELKPESLKLLTAGESSNPQAYELYLKGRGRLQYSNTPQNINEAISFLERAIKLDSSFVLANACLGESYLRNYRITKEVKWVEKAIYYCSKAKELNGNIPLVRVILSSVYSETGKYQEANEELQKVLELDPTNIDAYRERAKLFMAMGKPDEAELTYKKAIEMRPNYVRLYNYLGYLYYSQGRYSEAAEQYRQVIRLTPYNAIGFRNLGSMYVFLDLKKEAIDMYKKALEIEPDYRTYSNLAALYVKDGEFKNAARLFERVLEVRDTDYRIWGYLAAAYYRIPEEKEKSAAANLRAISLAEIQLKVNPNDQNALCSLASYYAMQGDRSKAILTLNKLEALEPTDVTIQCLIGEIYEEWLDDRDTALKWIRSAVLKGYPISDLKSRPALKELVIDRRIASLTDSVSSKKQ